MNGLVLGLIAVSVALSSSAQVLLKYGMSAASVQAALRSGEPVRIAWALCGSAGVVTGLLAFGLSVAAWLLVLSRTDVSFAYPFVALGIIATTLSGRFLLGEELSMLRLAGIAIVVVGVLLVAASGPTGSEP